MALPAYINSTTGLITDGEAWVALASTTLGSDAASITFSSPEDGSSLDWAQFLDLVLIGYARVTGSEVVRYITILCNNDSTGGNYTGQKFRSDGSASGEGPMGGPIWTYPLGASAGSNEFSTIVVDFLDINSAKYKSCMVRCASDSNGDGQVLLLSFAWKNQSPITSLVIDAYSSDNIVAGSRFDLFGILPRMVSA